MWQELSDIERGNFSQSQMRSRPSSTSVTDQDYFLPGANNKMNPRLEEASLRGDLDLLYQLLQQDKLLLLSPPTAANAENPLHLAAALGHADFAHEILNRSPNLARQFNGYGFTPLHLASANGHLPVVKELLKKSGLELCCLRDKDGFTPIHTAAIRGRVDIMAELADACPESVRAVTYGGESVLHLAVKSNCFDAAKYLVERIDDREFINSKDEIRGNTALHLAVARKQLQTVKLLMSKHETIDDVNATNMRGFTPLDVLLESPSDHGDLTLGESIRASGGKIASELGAHGDELITTPHHRRITKYKDYSDAPGTLMVVATLIAAITFQAGLNPPGGFFQSDSKNITTNTPLPIDSVAGTAVLDNHLSMVLFLVFDVVGLFASLSIILLLICVVPRKRKTVMKILVWIMWVAVFSTALAFQFAINMIYINSAEVIWALSYGWCSILIVAIVLVNIRFIICLLRWAGWMNRNESEHGETERSGFSRVAVILLAVMVVVVVGAVVLVIFYLGVLII